MRIGLEAHPMQLRYDRGTVLLTSLPEDFSPTTLPGLLWDERVRAYRSPGRHYSNIVKRLHAVYRDPVDDQVTAGAGVLPGAWAQISLRPYQETAAELWNSAAQRGIIVLPTGAGKTRLALAVISENRCRTLCLVPTRALLEQWEKEIKRVYAGQIGILGDGKHTLAPLTISTYESAYRGMNEFGNYFDLLVVDECHHFGRGARDEILEMSVASRRIGLTATLPTAEDWLERLDQLIGPPVFELGLSDLTGSYLADFDYYTLHVSLSPEERFRYELEMAVFRTVHSAFREACPHGNYLDWVRFAGRSQEGRKALQAFHSGRRVLTAASAKMQTLDALLRRHWGRKILIFTADTETAYQIARDHLIMPITSEIGRKEREEMLRAFREGRIKTLVSCRVLNEGLDVPDAEVAVILGGTQGAREHIQRIGRILRPNEKKRAVVYEVVCRGTTEVRQARTRSQSIAAPIVAAF